MAGAARRSARRRGGRARGAGAASARSRRRAPACSRRRPAGARPRPRGTAPTPSPRPAPAARARSAERVLPPGVALRVLAPRRGVDHVHARRRAARLGELDEPPPPAHGDLLQRREVLHRVRVAEQHDRGPRAAVAVDAAGERVARRRPGTRPRTPARGRHRRRAATAGAPSRRPGRRACAAAAAAPSACSAARSGGDEIVHVSATPQAITSAVAAGAAASVILGIRTWTLERRIGSSIQRCVTTVGISEAATIARPAAVESGPNAAAAKTRTGQCQTYQAYDRCPTQRTGASDRARVGAGRRRARAGGEQRRRAQPGSSAGRAGTAVAGIEGDGRHGDRRHAAPGRRRGAPSRQPPAGQGQGQQTAERQLPRPRRGGEVRLLGGDAHAPDRVHERGGRGRAEHGDEHPRGGAARWRAAAAATAGRTAPRRRATRSGRAARPRAGREVVDRLGREVPVHRVDAGRHHVRGDAVRLHRRQQERRHERDRDDRRDRLRHQPLDPPRVEARQRDAPAAVELGDQQLRDQEARDDEEHVDADVAAAGGGDARMGQQHDGERERSQPLDVGAKVEGCARRHGRSARARGHPTTG